MADDLPGVGCWFILVKYEPAVVGCSRFSSHPLTASNCPQSVAQLDLQTGRSATRATLLAESMSSSTLLLVTEIDKTAGGLPWNSYFMSVVAVPHLTLRVSHVN